MLCIRVPHAECTHEKNAFSALPCALDPLLAQDGCMCAGPQYEDAPVSAAVWRAGKRHLSP